MSEGLLYTLLLVVMTTVALYIGLKVGASQALDLLLARAGRRMSAEEYKAFKLLIVSLLFKEDGDK